MAKKKVVKPYTGDTGSNPPRGYSRSGWKRKLSPKEKKKQVTHLTRLTMLHVYRAVELKARLGDLLSAQNVAARKIQRCWTQHLFYEKYMQMKMLQVVIKLQAAFRRHQAYKEAQRMRLQRRMYEEERIREEERRREEEERERQRQLDLEISRQKTLKAQQEREMKKKGVMTGGSGALASVAGGKVKSISSKGLAG